MYQIAVCQGRKERIRSMFVRADGNVSYRCFLKKEKSSEWIMTGEYVGSHVEHGSHT